MNYAADLKPALWLRIAQFPATRLIVLGGALFLLMAKSNGFRLKLSASPWTTLAVTVAMTALALAVYAGFVRLVERRSVTELALPGMGRQLGSGVLIGTGLYTACVLILMMLGVYRIDGLNSPAVMLPAVAMALSTGIFEELVFRGVLFRIAEETFGSWIALAVSSLVFGFMHLLNPAGTITGAIFISIEAGMLLGAAYMLTRRLWVSVGFHIAWNYTQSGVFSGIVSGGDANPGLIKATIDGPPVLTGGSFGLEASAIAFALCTLTGVALLILAVRRGHIIPVPWNRTSKAKSARSAPIGIVE